MNRFDPQQLEEAIFQFGSEVLSEIEAQKPGMLDPQFYTERLMEYSMQDEEVKVSMFRFVDVLPNLQTASSVIQHVQEYFEPCRDKIPAVLQKGMSISADSLMAGVAAKAIRKQVRFIADRFIVGETPAKALSPLQKLRKQGLAFTVDLVGEATVSEAEASVYLNRYLELLDTLSTAVSQWPEHSPRIPDHRCEATPINISVKLSALYSQLKPIAFEANVNELVERLSRILAKAKEVGGFVYVDMEDCSMTSTTLAAFKRTLELPEFRDYPRCGIVMQAYLRRTKSDLEELITWVKKRGVPVAVRLVKGAYWDTETILAIQHGWPIPVWQEKCNSDATFEELSLLLLQNHELIIPAFGSHNVRSLAHACKAAEAMGISPTQFELQTLYGMGDAITKAFAERGYLVRQYAPIGELIPGMGYLVRRLLENTSNEGFLRTSLHEGAPAQELLRTPRFSPEDSGTAHLQRDLQEQFHNSPLRDFTLPEIREEVFAVLYETRNRLLETPASVVPVISGQPQTSGTSIPSLAPQDATMHLATIELADVSLADKALAALAAYFPSWRATSVQKRAGILFKAAELMEQQRAALTSAVVLEAGKPIPEADADIAEAIDFCRYYAFEAEKIFQTQQMGSLPGEINRYFYEPRGITLVISPWNFPFAIPCGMFAASLVCGNCCILKPAEQTSYIASLLFNLFLEAGMPPEAAAFLPGIGETIGAHLAADPLVDTICFTGSKAVGLELLRIGGSTDPRQRHVKKVIAEMGGKNAIIVDEDADLDEAVKGIIKSAFGYSGQKCSACSRVIAVGSSYERLLERLGEATVSVPVGEATDPATIVGPLVDADAQNRLQRAIAEAKKDCRLLAEGSLPDSLPEKGFYVPPTVFCDIPARHPLLTNELFGPVAAVQQADDFEQALQVALDSEYALTGGVYSRSPRNIERAMEEFRVGNLYINRNCTGALVFRQPFGGFAMSGVGSKAGGPDYLHQFLLPRSVTENTMRRGFAPID